LKESRANSRGENYLDKMDSAIKGHFEN